MKMLNNGFLLSRIIQTTVINSNNKTSRLAALSQNLFYSAVYETNNIKIIENLQNYNSKY